MALGLSGLYAGDYLCARYRIPADGQTLGSVQVNTLYAVRQKSAVSPSEYSMRQTEFCVRSLFPHLGYIPCWYLRRQRRNASRSVESINPSAAGALAGRPRRRRAPRRSFHAAARRVRAALPAHPATSPESSQRGSSHRSLRRSAGARAPAGARRRAGWRNALSDWPGRTGKVGLAPDRWRADRARGTSVERGHCVRVAQVSGNAVFRQQPTEYDCDQGESYPVAQGQQSPAREG